MGELVKDNLLEKLESSGLKMYSSLNTIDNTDNNSNNKEILGQNIKIYPSYRNNFGFFYAEVENIKFIILKGQYSDNIRNISGTMPFNNAEVNNLLDTIFKAERVATCPLIMDIFMCDNGECYIKNAVITEETYKDDIRDYHIPRPLSSSEYSESKSRIYDEDVILSSGYFSSFLPNVCSYFLASICSDLQDILNPLFISCNLKTSSPSIVNVCGRPYINMTGYEKMMHTIGLNKSLYRRVFSPNLFLKMGISKLDKINRSFFPVTYKEIREILDDLKSISSKINIQNVTDKSFYDYIVQFAIVYEYVTIEFTNSLSVLLKKLPNISYILNAIYKTRKNSIFYNDDDLILPEYIDFSSKLVPIKFNLEKNIDKIEHYLRVLSFFTSKSKLKKTITSIHKILDMRDELYLYMSEFIVNTRKSILKIGEMGVTKNKLDNKEDIFFLEHDEIKRLLHDTLFGETKELVCFRKWRNKRYATQLMPPEIYAYDLSDTAHIAEDMIIRQIDTKQFKIYGLNEINIKGRIEKDLNLDDYSDKIIAAYNLSMPKLIKYRNAKGMIIENISPLSFATEFAILNNIPLWTGVRFSSLFLDNINIEKDTLFQVNDE